LEISGKSCLGNCRSGYFGELSFWGFRRNVIR
jgi:hypothetical protein